MKGKDGEKFSSEQGASEKPKGFDYAIILLVFALTGTTAAVVPRFLMPFTGLESGFLYYLIYFIVITPIYLVLLRMYAFIFGKSAYFKEKEKHMIGWVKGIFKRNS